MAEGERTVLGLTHNPFVPPQSGFFERGGRRRHLEQLRHLSEWSRRILLVTGPAGSGKTMLFRELLATLEPRVKAARINGALVNTGREVLAAIAQGFGQAVPANVSVQGLRQMLLEHVEEQTAKDRPCLALVDDAQLLDNRAVAELMTLTHDSPLHLVLFGEPRLAPVIERAASARGVGWQEIPLPGYANADAREYLEWRFQQARYRGRVPFTDQQVHELVRESGGLPGRLDELANELLEKLERGESTRPRAGFPRQHAALVGLGVVVIGLLYVLVGGGDRESAQPAVEPASLQASATPEPSAAVEPGSAGAGRAEPLRSPGVDVGAEQEVEPSAEGARAASPATADGPATSGTEADSDATPAPAGAPTGQAGLIEPAPAPATAEGPRSAEVAVSGAVQRDADAESGSGPAPGEAEVAAAPADAVTRAAASAEDDAAPTSAGAVDIGSSATSEPGAASRTTARGTAWLLDQDPEAFTLQLVTVSSRDRAEAFVARQRDPGEFVIFELERGGQTLHVVLLGLYPTRDQALAAADALPPEVGDVRPWVRPLEQVQAVAR